MSITVTSAQERSTMTVSSVRSIEPKKADITNTGMTKDSGTVKSNALSSALGKEATSVQEKEVNEEEVYKAIEKANESFKGKNARFEYSIHEDTKRIMVKVVDPVSDEVIKEIPAEKILDMVAKIWEISGMFVDEKR